MTLPCSEGGGGSRISTTTTFAGAHIDKPNDFWRTVFWTEKNNDRVVVHNYKACLDE